MRRLNILVVPLLLSGCGLFGGAPTYTLYRNSIVSLDLNGVQARSHVATFDADESGPNFNRDNCNMAARLYNANKLAFEPLSEHNPVQRQGWWCEEGNYRGGDEVPAAFKAQFPTDTE